MRLAQRDKELAAIGASIGCNCRPCIEHHIPAGRDEAIELLRPRVDELLGGDAVAAQPKLVGETSRAHELVSLGASVGANSHALLERHIPAALGLGLSAVEVAAALKMARYVENRASEMTAEKATRTLAERAGLAADSVKEEGAMPRA